MNINLPLVIPTPYGNLTDIASLPNLKSKSTGLIFKWAALLEVVSPYKVWLKFS